MIETSRLTLRPWRDSDREPFAAMSRDPEVMATLGPLMTREESDALVDGRMAHQAEHGFCFWAVERRSDGAFLGSCGLKRNTDIPILQGVLEIGWRLQRDAWGHGYAREAAQASIDWGTANHPNLRILAITTPGNSRSWGLMERLGMKRLADGDFDHPLLAPGDHLRPHITYTVDHPEV